MQRTSTNNIKRLIEKLSAEAQDALAMQMTNVECLVIMKKKITGYSDLYIGTNE
jgi:hypothetical protein